MTYLNNTDTTFKSYMKPDRAVKSKKRYKVPLRSKKAKNSPKTLLKQTWGYSSQIQLFEALWERALKEGEGKVICPFTNINLTAYAERDMSYYLSCFAHLLPKGTYPLYKLYPWNVRVVAPIFHRIVDQGRLSDRAKYPEYKWDVWDKLVETMKVEYAEWVKVNT